MTMMRRWQAVAFRNVADPNYFLACPRFESSDLLVFPPVDTVCCRSCRLANAQLILELSLNNALSQIGQDSRGNSNGFQS